MLIVGPLQGVVRCSRGSWPTRASVARARGDGARLEVETPLAGELAPGDSIAVNGVCLTAVEPRRRLVRRRRDGRRRSGAPRSAPLGEGDEVNLELPLRAGDRLGGHVVQGHVDGTGTVESVRRGGLRARGADRGPARAAALRRREGLDRGGRRVAYRWRRWTTQAFEVSLIPETLERTTLGAAAPGPHGEPGGGRAGEVRGEAEGPMTNPPFSTIEEAIEDIRDGKMVVVCDAEDRENEGDLTMAAQFATPEAINFMATHGRGLICLALTGERCDELGPRPDGGEERVALPDRVHGLDRGARGHHHRHLGARPRAHDPGGDRPEHAPAGPRPARATSSR